MPKAPTNHRSNCPLSISLEIFGDRWTLLVIRDLLFKDRHEFGDFLKAEEGVATNVLADRLRRLEEHGIVEKAPHPVDARKAYYSLTEKGFDLAPVLMEIIVWAAKYQKTAAPQSIVARMATDRDAFLEELRAKQKFS